MRYGEAGKQLADQDIVVEKGDGLGEDGIIVVESGGKDPVIEDRVCEDIDKEDILLSNKEVKEVDGDLVSRGVQDGGHSEMEGECLMEHLISFTRLLPHVLPIRGGILQFPRDKGFSLPRHHESDARVRVQSIPQHVAEEAKESDQGEGKNDDNQGEGESIHDFYFLALWWLYSGKSDSQVILYSVIRG